MQKAIMLGGVIAAAFVVAPQAAAQIQPGGSGAGKFCLQPKAGGPPRCFYQTMADAGRVEPGNRRQLQPEPGRNHR